MRRCQRYARDLEISDPTACWLNVALHAVSSLHQHNAEFWPVEEFTCREIGDIQDDQRDRQ